MTSPISNAAFNGDIETIKLLLAEGVDIEDKTNRLGSTPLMIAAQQSNGSSSIETVRFLLEAGANVNATNNYGETALTLTVDSTITTSSKETVRLLLEYGADVNQPNNNGATPLIFASRYSNDETSIEKIRLLLEYGANVNAANVVNNTALTLAARHSTPNVVRLLLDAGADPYTQMLAGVPEGNLRIIHEYIWKLMYNIIKLKAKQFSRSENFPEGDLVLPYDVWELILLRQKQQQLCKSLYTGKHRYILMGFAEMLEIPIYENINKAKLCNIISEQLAWGGKYSPDSLNYTNKRYNETRENIIRLAYKLGIDIHQPINKILDEISQILNFPIS